MKIEDILKIAFKSPQQKALINLRYTNQIIAQRQQNFMDQYGLTMPQFNILRILRGANATLNVNTIKDRMIEKSPNTTRLMDKLIDKQLIERVRCEEDRRVVYVKINAKGLDLLNQIDLQFDQQMNFSYCLSEEEASHLSDLLDKLRNQLVNV